MIQLIGGEMTHWSDLSGDHGPAPAGGPALRLLPAAARGRTLVAGPHDPALIDALPVAQITVLVRGVDDATSLASRYESRPGLTVCCGSLEKLGATPSYDTVLALDGVERLCTPEAPDLSWDETLGRLLAVLRPGGRLLLGVPNAFGLDRLLALPPAPADTDWAVADDSPTAPDALQGRLAMAGFPVVREYAAYPSALLGAEVLADPALRGYLEATIARPAGAPLLADPARLVSGALRHGLAASLAPRWILLAGALDAGPAAIVETGPAAIVETRPAAIVGPSAAAVVGSNAAAVGSHAAAVVGSNAAAVGSHAAAGAGPLSRDAAGTWMLGETPVPLGRTLADLLLAAARRRAMPDMRSLLTAWQAGPAAGVPATQVVVDADGVCHGLAPAGNPLLALRALAATLIDGGHAHLWPSPADEAGLTALLAGMTGRELSPLDVPAGSPRPGAGTVRELTIARDRLTQELADARAKHEFYERTIAGRDAELKRVRQINALLSATAPGKAVLGGLKAGRRAVRAVVRRARG